MYCPREHVILNGVKNLWLFLKIIAWANMIGDVSRSLSINMTGYCFSPEFKAVSM